MRTFRSVEFRDGEGDLVVCHAFLDDAEAEKAVQDLLAIGATEVSIADLTPPAARACRAVTSSDGGAERRRLGEGT